MKTILFGASGTLGKELMKINPEMLCPSRSEVDITDFKALKLYIDLAKPELIIHAAGEIDNRKIETSPNEAIKTNIIGTANISMLCEGIRLIYISTDYIYKGDRGNYKEDDEILPFNLYSWTKLGGECSVKAVVNHLIIRTSFGKDFQYSEAFIDKWTSKDYVDKIAPMIYEAAMSPVTGVLNIGTERKTLYDHAKERNVNVKGVKISDTNFHTPYDTSLNLQKWYDYKNENPIAKPHTKCRVCEGELKKYLDLGLLPLANNLDFTAQLAKNKQRYPLQVMFCERCNLSQLSVVIDPEKMFSYYTYRSGINKGYIEHCKKLAESFELKEDSLVIDIAGNDGTLLKQFKNKFNCRVLNVDPATNLTAIAENDGIESVTEFWSIDVANKIKEKYGQADLITATNVFAHVDDVVGFLKAAKLLLKPKGEIIIEFPYLRDFIDKKEFDTIYFEHLSYMSILPLTTLCGRAALQINDIEILDIHGGSLRVTLIDEFRAGGFNSSMYYSFCINEKENRLDSISKYISWSDEIKKTIYKFSIEILELKRQGKTIAAFGASAKGNTLLNCCKMNTDMVNYIVDETPEKIGKFSPGTGIPIVNKSHISKYPPDYIILLSWNFADEIMEKLKPIYKGKFIIPIPEFKIL